MNKLYILLAILMMAGCSGSANRDGSDDIGISSGTDSSVSSSTGIDTSSSGSDTNTSSVSSSSTSSSAVSDVESCKAFWNSFPKEIVDIEWIWDPDAVNINYQSFSVVLPKTVSVSQDGTINIDAFTATLSADNTKILWSGYLYLVANPSCSATFDTVSTHNEIGTNRKVSFSLVSVSFQ